MKHNIKAVRADAFTLTEMKVRSVKNRSYDTADYNGVFMDYVMEDDGVRVTGTIHKYYHDADKPFNVCDYYGEEVVKEAFWVLAELVGVDVVYQGNNEYHIEWVTELPPKPVPEFVVPKNNYFLEIFFVLLVFVILTLPLLAAGYNEAIFEQKLQVQKEWYNAHPDADILIFNCVTDDMKVKCPNGAEKRFEVTQ